MADATQFCTFYLNKHFFGIEVEKVQEVFRYQEMTPIPLAPPTIKGLINLRGQIMTAIDLRKRLQMPDRPDGELPMNVVIRTPGGAVSLLVDEIGDVLEMSLDDYEPPPDTIEGITRDLVRGVYKLEGTLLLILDTTKTIDFGEPANA